MKAMIFAAGRGNRMRPLTDTAPKPLLKVGGRPLIVWHIQNLVRAGITELVINHHYLGQMLEDALGDGSKYGAQISWSPEPAPLETAGGIAYARELLGDEPFVAVSADIYCPQFDYAQAIGVLEDNDPWGQPLPVEKRDAAWLFMVNNPPEHPEGDFAVNAFSLANEGEQRYTYSGIGVFRPEMFAHIAPGECVKLVTILREHAARGTLGGDIYRGPWRDIGTPERLEQINAAFFQGLSS